MAFGHFLLDSHNFMVTALGSLRSGRLVSGSSTLITCSKLLSVYTHNIKTYTFYVFDNFLSKTI